MHITADMMLVYFRTEKPFPRLHCRTEKVMTRAVINAPYVQAPQDGQNTFCTHHYLQTWRLWGVLYPDDTVLLEQCRGKFVGGNVKGTEKSKLHQAVYSAVWIDSALVSHNVVNRSTKPNVTCCGTLLCDQAAPSLMCSRKQPGWTESVDSTLSSTIRVFVSRRRTPFHAKMVRVYMYMYMYIYIYIYGTRLWFHEDEHFWGLTNCFFFFFFNCTMVKKNMPFLRVEFSTFGQRFIFFFVWQGFFSYACQNSKQKCTRRCYW